MLSLVLSVGVHLAVVASLAVVGTYSVQQVLPVAVEATTMTNDIPLTSSEIAYSDLPDDTVGMRSEDAGSGGGIIDGTGYETASSSTSPAAGPQLGIAQLPAFDLPEMPSGDIRLRRSIMAAAGPRFSENVSVPGAPGVGTSGAVGAVDRITQEIMLSLEQRKTLVIWMLDSTPSLAPQREAIRKRFNRVYEELGILEASKNPAFRRADSKPLLTAIVSFGRDIDFLTPRPTDSLDELHSAVESLKTDSSGIENTFAAIQQVLMKFRHYRTQAPRRNVMLVVLTDEAGDDESGIDATVSMCRKLAASVYVIGAPAPFGSRDAMMKYLPPHEFEQAVMWVPVHQGPESYQPELINVGFSERRFREPLDSGFGPYGLTRLCYETGGIYFAVHPNRTSRRRVSEDETSLLSSRISYFFDPEVMRGYRPDYLSTKQYDKMISENKARSALVRAAQTSMAGMDQPPLEFPKEDDADFAMKLSKAQQQAAVVEPRINQLYEILKTGEKDRPKLSEPRWQAGYDLAMGRVLAIKVRTEAYNAMLAKARQGMKFKNPHNDTWELEAADEITVGSVLEKQARQAKEYLMRVAREHKGTPWGLMAQNELDEKFGWRWRETFTNVIKKKDRAVDPMGGPGNVDDVRKMLKKPLPRAPLPRL